MPTVADMQKQLDQLINRETHLLARTARRRMAQDRDNEALARIEGQRDGITFGLQMAKQFQQETADQVKAAKLAADAEQVIKDSPSGEVAREEGDADDAEKLLPPDTPTPSLEG